MTSTIHKVLPLGAAALLLAASPARAELIYGVGTDTTATTPTLSLFSFDSGTPGTISSLTAITGITTGALVGIDFRPTGAAAGGLYGLSYDAGTQNAQLYTIALGTGVASSVGAAFNIGSALGTTGNSFGFAFNPVADRIRVVTGNGSNFRINPNNGALVTFDNDVAYAPTDRNANGSVLQVGALDYTPASGGATTLYDIDQANDVLVTQTVTTPAGGATDGQLNSAVMNLGVNAPSAVTMGFDISNVTGTAFLQTSSGGGIEDNLYTVALTGANAGTASLVGRIGPAGFNTSDSSVFVAPVPEPGTYALCAVGLAVGAFGLRRRRVSV